MKRLILAFAILIAGSVGAFAQPNKILPVVPASQSAARSAIGLLPDSGLAPRRNRLTFAPAFGGASTYTSTGQTVAYAVPMIGGMAGQWRMVTMTVPGITPGYNLTGRFRPSSDWGGASSPDYLTPTDPNCVMGGGCIFLTLFQWQGGDSDQHTQCCTGTVLSTPSIVTPDPNTGSTATARMVMSDWIPIVPIAPTTGAYPVMMVRLFETAGTTVKMSTFPGDTSETGSTWTGNAALNSGMDYSVKTSVGNNTGFSGGTWTNGQGPVWGWQFEGGTPGIQVLSCSDSQLAGHFQTSDMGSFINRVVTALSTAALPVSYANAGWVGAQGAQLIPPCLDAIKIVKPSICVLESYLSNDDVGGAASLINVQENLGRLSAVATKCKEQGGKVIWITPLPRNTSAGSVWISLYQQVLGFGDASTSVCDIGVLSSTQSGGLPTGNWISTYTSDNIHGNDAWAIAMMPAFKACLQKVAGLN